MTPEPVTPEPAMDRASRWPKLVALVLALATLALYLPVTGYEFNNYDDGQYITKNPWVQYGLRRETIAWAFTSGYASNWHPLTWMSHMLDWQIYGPNAGGHHLTSLLFHVANSVLLFGLLWRLTRALGPSAFVAAVFAWHPLRVESVAWVAERKDVLCAFFGLLTLWAWTRYVEESKVQSPKSKVSYCAALLLFVLGLMSKPMLVSLPFILFLLDFWPLNRVAGFQNAPSGSSPWPRGFKRLFLEKIPFMLLAAISCVVTYFCQKASGATAAIGEPFRVKFANAIDAYAAYLGKLFWPHRLAVFYPYQHHPAPLQVVTSALLLTAVTVMVLRLARRLPFLAAGWFWFLIMLGPVIGVVQVGEQSMADRYTYLPGIGIAIMVAWGIPKLLARIRPSAMVIAPLSLIVLAACIVTTRIQLPVWRDSISLFSHAITVTGPNSVAQSNLAEALYSRGDLDGAWLHVNEALRIREDYPQAMNNKALLLSRRGQGEEAVALLKQVIAERPKWPDSRKNIGQILMDLGRLDEAMPQFREVIQYDPTDVQAITDLGICLAKQGHLEDAITQYRRALAIVPNAFAENALGGALDAQGHAEEAAKHYQAAIQLKPDFAEAYNNLGALLNSTGHFADAREQFLTALKIKPGFAEAHFNLGVCSLALGDLTNALAEFSADLSLQTNDAGAHLNLGRIFAHEHDLTAASNHFASALRLEPDSIEARNGLADVLLQQGDETGALALYRDALRRETNSADTMRNLAWVLATSPSVGVRDPVQALQLVAAADQLAAPGTPSEFGIRAAALAAAGHFPDAVTAETRALDLVTTARQTNLIRQVQSRIDLYQSHQPYVRPATNTAH